VKEMHYSTAKHLIQLQHAREVCKQGLFAIIQRNGKNVGKVIPGVVASVMVMS